MKIGNEATNKVPSYGKIDNGCLKTTCTHTYHMNARPCLMDGWMNRLATSCSWL